MSVSHSSIRQDRFKLTTLCSASMATVSLNLERHVRASWSLIRAGGPRDNVKLVISDAICHTRGTKDAGDAGVLQLLIWFVGSSPRLVVASRRGDY
jgi:hypothetical protein